MWDACESAFDSSHHFAVPAYQNPIAAWGLRLLRRSNFGVCLTDKDAGFALMDRRDIIPMKRDILRGASYEPAYVTMDLLAQHISQYREVCQLVGETIFPLFDGGTREQRRLVNSQRGRFVQTLVSDCKMTPWSLVSMLNVTIKTHKPQGRVVPRPIHATPAHPMNPGMRWLASEVREALRPYGHLLRDSDHFLTLLKGLEFSGGDRWYKCDVKDFFMSGEHSRLVEHSSALIGESHRAAFQQMCEVVLAAQYITVPGYHREHFRVIVGSGMGLTASGEISDCCLVHMTEVPTFLNDRFRDRFAVKLYCRFKDDIIFCLGAQSAASRREAVEALVSHGRFFKIEVETVATVWRYAEEALEIPFLDVAMTPRQIGDDLFVMDVRPYSKPTSLWTPLSHTSCHMPTTHVVWPLSFVERLRRHSSTTSIFKAARDEFKQRLQLFAPGHPGLRTGPAAQARKNTSTPTSYLVLPYHTVWRTARITALLSQFDSRLSSVNSCRTRISWSLGGAHLMRLAQSFNFLRTRSS